MKHQSQINFLEIRCPREAAYYLNGRHLGSFRGVYALVVEGVCHFDGETYHSRTVVDCYHLDDIWKDKNWREHMVRQVKKDIVSYISGMMEAQVSTIVSRSLM